MTLFKILLLAGIAFVTISAPTYAAGDHDHGTESHATEAPETHGDGHGHNEKPHFAITKPETVNAAWIMIDETIITARQALKDNKIDALHEAGEKLAVAVSTLHEHPQATKEGNGEKIIQALDQLTKTVDRFHHATEDKDTAGATEALDLLESQKGLVKSIYPTVK